MSARTPDAVAALREAAIICGRHLDDLPDEVFDSPAAEALAAAALEIHALADAATPVPDPLAEARALIRDLATELEAEIAQRYAGALNYPAMRRRFDYDMDTVQRARRALGMESDE